MQYVFDFSWNIAVIIVQSRLKLYDFTILAAGVEPNKFLISSHNGAIMGLFIELKTEFKLAQVISMQFRKKITVGCCEERQNSPS